MFLKKGRKGWLMERKFTKKLVDWKNQAKKKCLVVQGARQIGKTYTIREFGAENYNEVIEINFKETPSAKEMFSGDISVDTMLTALRFRYPEKKILPKNSLIFLDEIQECEEAVTSLKFFSQDGRFDVIVSGSLLGIDYKRASSYPVGYVTFEKMHGFDFEEFLWAIGVSKEMNFSLRDFFNKRTVVPVAINSQMMNHFRTFIALGGMPEVIKKYVETKDFREADKVQRDLLNGYLYDIAHYADASEKIKAEKCFLSLGKQLLEKENHKFQYKEVEKNGKAQKYFNSVEWLKRADIACISMNVTKPAYELCDYEKEDNFRVYTSDLSLLLSMRDFSLKQQIVENSFTGNSKGGIYECAVADSFIKNDYALHFYKNESTKREIDFILQKDGNIVPVEVKAGASKSQSLSSFMKNHPEVPLAYKLTDGNIGMDENRILTVPLWMSMFL